MMELVISSYIPTISALLRAQSTRDSRALHVLAVAQPDALGEAVALPSATLEVATLQSLLRPTESTILVGRDATVNAATSALEKCTWAHFACHAFQDVEHPTKSAILLHDGHFTLANIARCSLQDAQFAFLSACQSATGSASLPNESVHIAAGLQFAGFRGVVGTMWSIHDDQAAFIAKQFYDQMFKDHAALPQASEAARALHLAVQRLRKQQAQLAQWVPFIHIGI